ncbi:MAG: DNA cytosine methyltransferase [Verrucomicrobiota bacterium]
MFARLGVKLHRKTLCDWALLASGWLTNHGPGHFHLGSIEHVTGSSIPQGDIVWASFPCQDLSLAGRMGGLTASRSGLFWEWLHVLDEMPVKPAVRIKVSLNSIDGVLASPASSSVLFCIM